MRLIYLFACLVLFLFLGQNINAQQRDCGSMDYLQQQLQEDPKRAIKMESIENFTRNYLNNNTSRIDGIITIPVVVHIVWNTTAENISDAQINSQIQVLNEDFRRMNSDADGTWPQASDSEIEFCLAAVDPSGNATSGITRTNTSVTSFSTNDNVKFNSSGGKDAWPSGDYLNFWVCDLSGGLLGYAQFPGGNPATDGVVNDYAYTGSGGSAQAPFDLGRTATHEVGHWLNLRHIWGDGGCGVDDNVSDTPLSDASNGGCATGHVSCSTVDMVQNYMDYSDDACMNLFTLGQRDRMRALFDPGGARASLLNSTACGSGNPPTCTDGIQNGSETGVDCGGPDCPACPTCFDGMQNGQETGVDCGGPDCAACPCPGTNITVTINLDNYPEETSWTLVDGNGNTVGSGGTYGNQPDGSTVTEDFCLADGCYDFTIFDTYGDGICCSYGNGSYVVTDANGNTYASGGTFGSSEATNFCLGGGNGPTCTDGIQNGQETGVDCGGPDCPVCPSCNDGVQNGSETGVDCGGPDCPACPTCFDGIQNGQETGVDCGGPDCIACSSCNDGVQNGQETDVDCGGPDCPACPTCFDGIQNGQETGVDCGGPDCTACSSCSGTTITVSITLDNYPEETSWTLVDGSGNTVGSGGTYGNQPDGSTVTEELCLVDGCYDFTIFDTYGDGICCSYGNGSYAVTDDNGTTYASGGAFGSSENTNFCLGGGNGPTCTDGIQNGQETGVDCGGPDCPACPGGNCSYVNIDFNDFNSWGIWNDGGSDCRRSGNDAAYANSGNLCVRLRDNTSSSTMTTDNLNLTGYDELTVDFTFIAVSMENNEDFWLQVSTNGGSSYTTVGSWASGSDFSNNVREFPSVVIPGPFTANTRLRFRCDASANGDRVYIDDVFIDGCANSTREIVVATPDNANEISRGPVTATTGEATLTNFELYPNPTSDQLNVSFNLVKEGNVQLMVTDFTGKTVQIQQIDGALGQQLTNVDASALSSGFYFVHLITNGKITSKKFVVTK